MSRNMETFERLMREAEFETDLTSDASKRAMTAAFAPDFEIVQPSSLPQGGVHKGRDEWLKMLEIMRSRWKQRIRHDEAWDLEDSDLIIMHSSLEWTSKTTGRTAAFPAIELLWFRDGLISKVEMFFHDTKVILDTLNAEERSLGTAPST